jgi:uncharacterized protein (DUF1499 family)
LQNFESDPAKPNWVSSRTSSKRHQKPPLSYSGNLQEMQNALKQVVESMPGGRVVSIERETIRCEYTTRFLRFVDDVIFECKPALGQIDFISKSRIGHSDLGANAKRIEKIRDLLTKR